MLDGIATSGGTVETRLAAVETDVAGKAEAISGGVENNIVTIDASSEPKDSGVAISTDGTFSGNSDSAVPTEKATKTYTEAYTDGLAIGVGQTWQNVAASRSLGVDYTNTTGRPIAVSMSAQGTVATPQTINLTVGGIIISEDAISISGSGTWGNVFGIIPAGTTYRISSTSGGAIRYWAELR
jgi:hypothetical protein